MRQALLSSGHPCVTWAQDVMLCCPVYCVAIGHPDISLQQICGTQRSLNAAFDRQLGSVLFSCAPGLVKQYPTFRDRSENPEVATEISLQPWRSYQTDGVILFSDILTPLPVSAAKAIRLDEHKHSPCTS